jgi:hypothetical protein
MRSLMDSAYLRLLEQSPEQYKPTDTGFDMSDVLEINATTGETIQREFTAEEKTQRELDDVAEKKAAKDAAAKAAADAAATAAAIAHAKSIGFTDEMIAVMYPNIGAQS